MLWFGYTYYIVFNILLCVYIFSVLKLLYIYSVYRFTVFSNLNKIFNIWVLFLKLSLFTFLNATLNSYQNLIYVSRDGGSNIQLLNYLDFNYFTNLSSFSQHIYNVYTYPFIYVFLLITILSLFFCLSYNFDELYSFMFFCIFILLSGYVLFFTDSLILFFLAYEMLLVPSFFILYKFAKTRRCVEASYLMFFWTQFGAFFIIFAFLYIFLACDSSLFSVITLKYFSIFETNFIFICLLFGFGVKLPIWPFYGWLPKAHVEASTNFSIFLSGVLVKFAFFGFLKCLITINLNPSFIYVYPYLLIGISDSVLKLFYQIDLKKLVAYSTVVEMHWLTMCVVCGQSNLLFANFCMLISHALLSTNSFLLVDAVARRFKTRLITEISGINFTNPKLFLTSLLNCLIFLGFPGSIFFIAEILFFSFVFDLFPTITLVLLLLLYLIAPTFFFRSWINLMFSKSLFFSKYLPVDLTSREFLLFVFIPLLMFWLGFSWQSFII